MHEYEMMMRMSRDPRIKKTLRTKQGVVKKRLVNPIQFSSFYTNPLEQLTCVVAFVLEQQWSKKSKQKQFSGRDRDREEREYQMMMRQRIMMQRMYRHRGIRKADLEMMFKDAQPLTELQRLILQNSNKDTIQTLQHNILQYFQMQHSRFKTTRAKTFTHISHAIPHISIQYQTLKSINAQERWKQLNAILQSKVDRQVNEYHRRFKQVVQMNDLKKGISTLIQDKKMPQFNELSLQQQHTLYTFILLLISVPSKEFFLQPIHSLHQNLQNIILPFHTKDQDILRVLDYLPYKQSSFYWSKIIDCCRHISNCQNIHDLTLQKMQDFEAEFCGTVTGQTQRKCAEGQWISNGITSPLIQYLKHIEGANNYHEDDNFKGFLFNHSETAIFLTTNQQPNINYCRYDKLVFLVNIDNTHWLVIAANNISKEIVVYNSMDSHHALLTEYCQKIRQKLLSNFWKWRNEAIQYRIYRQCTPKQHNGNDCGVFAIVNLIMAFDKQPTDARKNNYTGGIISQIRNSLLLFLQYLGYCRRLVVVVRKDYFDVLFRSTIYLGMLRKHRR